MMGSIGYAILGEVPSHTHADLQTGAGAVPVVWGMTCAEDKPVGKGVYAWPS